MNHEQAKEQVSGQQMPSIGRIVHYRAYGTPGGEYKSEPRAAIITAVTDENVVSLCVLNPTGMFFNQNVFYGDGPGQWSWPPYVPKKVI